MLRALLLLVGITVAPQFATADVSAPHTISVVGCEIEDHTGEKGRQDPAMAAKGWRDYEWKIKDGVLLCKREEIKLTDEIAEQTGLPELNSDFGDYAVCASVAMSYGPKWEAQNKGYAVMAIGCPTKITSDGKVVGFKIPDCPREINGLILTCKFDSSLI